MSILGINHEFAEIPLSVYEREFSRKSTEKTHGILRTDNTDRRLKLHLLRSTVLANEVCTLQENKFHPKLPIYSKYSWCPFVSKFSMLVLQKVHTEWGWRCYFYARRLNTFGIISFWHCALASPSLGPFDSIFPFPFRLFLFYRSNTIFLRSPLLPTRVI